MLVVDDNLGLAENIAEFLAIEGYATDVATSAEEALPKAIASAVTFVVTDYRLPGINGADFVKRLRVDVRDVRAIVISGYADEPTALAASDAGASFLPKPVGLELLSRFFREPAGSV